MTENAVHEFAVKLHSGRLLFGYYESDATAHRALAEVAPDSYAGVWRGLNPLRSDSRLLSALNAPLQPRKHRAGAEDIASRAALLLDFDAICPRDEMSTDSEHGAAIAQAGQCSEWLQSLGWPRQKQVNSGRGCQLHTAVSLPADSSTDALIRNLLRSLKSRFALIDAGMHDRPRLARFPGFWNRKAKSPTSERPWRMAKLMDSGGCGLVTHEQIESAIAHIGLPALTQSRTTETPDPAKVQRTIERLAIYLDKIGVALKEIVPLSDGRTLLRLSHCPLDATHTGSSAGIGVSAAGHPLNFCKHSSCSMPWGEWRMAVELKHGVRMNLESRLIFSGARASENYSAHTRFCCFG
jgi:hypothetical protein